jgi:hypothetical protein
MLAPRRRYAALENNAATLRCCCAEPTDSIKQSLRAPVREFLFRCGCPSISDVGSAFACLGNCLPARCVLRESNGAIRGLALRDGFP